jgi:hypothetical protein
MAWLSESVEVALARSETAARSAAGTARVASEAMDGDLATRLASEVASGRMAGIRTLAAAVRRGWPARRVARQLLRQLPLTAEGPAGEARRLLSGRAERVAGAGASTCTSPPEAALLSGRAERVAGAGARTNPPEPAPVSGGSR